MDGIDVTTTDVSGRATRFQAEMPHHRPSWLRRHVRLTSFVICVLLPTAVATTYYCAFAADQYVSEAKFVVRGPTAQSQGMLSSLLQATGSSHTQEDAYAVQDYILSRDAVADLIKTQDLKAVFSRPEADRLARFPTISGRATLEDFFDYYQDHVEVALDTTTGVSTITVKTFRPDDSQRVAVALLTAGETLINRMNDRQRANTMQDARKEFGVAEARVQTITNQIAEFRNREALLDPNKQSVPMLASVNDLQTMLSRTNLQLAELRVSTPGSPSIPDLRRRAVALQGQIDDARAKITGTDSSLVPKIAAFDQLELQRGFADRFLASATSSLEAARRQSESQQVYLDTIVKPNIADYPTYPKPLVSIGTFFASLLGIYLLASMLISGALEHRRL